MASLIKDSRGRSPFWICCFTGPDGSRLKKSTKQANRTDALAICIKWEESSRKARHGTFTEAQARKVVSEIAERATGEPINFYSAADWLNQWLAGKLESKAAKTGERYEQIIKAFIAHLGSRARLNISHISAREVLSFRDARKLKGASPRTCNLDTKIIGAAFNAAKRQGLILANPVEALESLPVEAAQKGTFSPSQVASLIGTAQGDWKGAILFAYYTGARLRDVANMTWNAIDLQRRIISFTPSKTHKPVMVPLHPELEQKLLKKPGIGKAFLFPSLAGKGTGGAHGLSGQFASIMGKAGIVGKVTRQTAQGRSNNSLSFHSLRHSFNSAMANAGVSQEIRQKLTGHASAEMNTLYTHHEIEPLRAAISLIPGIRGV